MKRTALLLTLLLSAADWARAEIPHLQEGQESAMPGRILTLDSISTLPKPIWPRPWKVYAAPGVYFDQNINHLLINSTINSNIRVPDTIIHTEAGVTYRPEYWKKFKPQASYTFERHDYQDHEGFSYYTHQIYGAFDYWFTRRWALDTGIESIWYADEDGLVTQSQTPHLGGRWRYKRYRARAGYALRRSTFRYSPGKDAYANTGYFEISRSFFKRQLLYTYYDYRRSRADDAIYSFQSHYSELGWVNPWFKRFRVTWIASMLNKPYANFDRRFQAKRYEKTYSLTARPAFSIYPNLRLIGGYTYSENHSNVETKRYVDQIYRATLEARF
jgi:hypothetical protein